MDSRYQIFVAVVQEKSFTRAAEILGYSQSAVSQAVRSLEKELGTALIERSREGISLTEDGKEYLPYLRS
ncbi:MAG: LysR family transcriptional regulator, partial [Bulleidia sp.]